MFNRDTGLSAYANVFWLRQFPEPVDRRTVLSRIEELGRFIGIPINKAAWSCPHPIYVILLLITDPDRQNKMRHSWRFPRLTSTLFHYDPPESGEYSNVHHILTLGLF